MLLRSDKCLIINNYVSNEFQNLIIPTAVGIILMKNHYIFPLLFKVKFLHCMFEQQSHDIYGQ